RGFHVTGVQTCALPISPVATSRPSPGGRPGKWAALDCAADPAYLRPMHKLKLVVTRPPAPSGPTGISPMAVDIFTTLDWSEPPRSEARRVGKGSSTHGT